MKATTQGRPYQGYPYIENPVHDAPSIDPATASRWANLPRRQIGLPVRREINGHQHVEEKSDAENRLPQKTDPSPVVYIDMPETSSSLVSEERTPEGERPEPTREQDKRDPAPVVYIDLPGENGSVTQTPQTQTPREEPEFVQETIFYDPFENRRIEVKEEESERRGSDSEDDTPTQSSRPDVFRPLPAIRPSNLELYGAGTSGTSSTAQASVPPLMTKEALIYGQSDDGFPLSPIPVSEFPEPPPAYNEIDQVSSPVVDPVVDSIVEQPRTQDSPPRTQVIINRDHPAAPTTPMGIPNADRKYLTCHHCGMRVHSLVVRENGTITHVIALVCLIICLLPVVAFIYCTDVLKIKNHYCPNCNKIIGYELPFTGNNIVYVN